MTVKKRSPAFLYELMPIVVRRRDVERGGHALEALLAIVQQAFELLENDIAGLYDNWFVETCEPWVLPYLADLLAIPRALSAQRPAADLRRLVANVVDYRRRKGTPDALAEIAGDVSGWAMRAVEARRTLARYPHAGALRDDAPRTLDVRNLAAMADLGGPFDTSARTVDVRGLQARTPRRPGNTGELALFAWRDVPGTLEGVDAHHLGGHRYTFDPLGHDRPLLNAPVYDATNPERAVPAPLRTSALRDESVPGARPVFLTATEPAFSIELAREQQRATLSRDEIEFCNLANWAPRAPSKALVDVERGRFMLPSGWTEPRVDATWGSTGDVGGGAYRRRAASFAADELDAENMLYVARERSAGANWFSSLQAALDALTVRTGFVRITIVDSGTYVAPHGGWTIAAGVNVPHVELIAAAGRRPVLRGALTVRAEASGARIVIVGVVLDGSIAVEAHPDAADFGLRLEDATIVPRPGGGLTAASQVLDARIALHRAICGTVRLPELGALLTVTESILDGAGGPAICGVGGDAGPIASLDRCTVFGDVVALAAVISGSIVTGEVTVRDGEASSARHAVARFDGVGTLDALHAHMPRFVSRRFGHGAYARLSLDAGAFASSGAKDGGELGAYHAAATGRRLTNLQSVLDEYVPHGVRAGVIDER